MTEIKRREVQPGRGVYFLGFERDGQRSERFVGQRGIGEMGSLNCIPYGAHICPQRNYRR